jgi:hypothetical protein
LLCACDRKLNDPFGWSIAWIASEIMVCAIGDTMAQASGGLANMTLVDQPFGWRHLSGSEQK